MVCSFLVFILICYLPRLYCRVIVLPSFLIDSLPVFTVLLYSSRRLLSLPWRDLRAINMPELVFGYGVSGEGGSFLALVCKLLGYTYFPSRFVLHVNAIVPGFVLTGITKQKMEEQQDSGLKVTTNLHFLKRGGRPVSRG